MDSNEYKTLQIGMFICDHEDIMAPENYCMIMEFGRNGQMKLQPYDEHGNKADAHPFWIDRRDVNITEKMFASEYYALSHRFL